MGRLAQFALKRISSSPVVPLPTSSMGGSCSTVSDETRMANQLRESKGHPAPDGSRHAGIEPPNLAVYNIQDDGNWVDDVNGGGITAPGRSRRFKSPQKERVVGPERRPRRASVDGATMPKHANLSRARLIADSRALVVSSVKSVSNMLFDQQEERNHAATQKAERKYDQQQALTHAANQRSEWKFERACASAAPGYPELVAASRRKSQSQAPNASVARRKSVA